jgi:threonine/homoserine/homoserine lactone efflux protein
MIKINLATKPKLDAGVRIINHTDRQLKQAMRDGVPEWVLAVVLGPLVLVMMVIILCVLLCLYTIRYLHVLLCTVVLVGAAWMFYMYFQIV